jgi:DNA-binding NarL/FixJ family response regulator
MQNRATTSPPALLVVDSDARVRAAVTALLKVAFPALCVVEATNTKEALDAVRTTTFGVILVDAAQSSPRPNSSLIAHLRMTTDSIIIAMATRSHHRSAAQEAGAHEFISKAASTDILLPIINWAYGDSSLPKPTTRLG